MRHRKIVIDFSNQRLKMPATSREDRAMLGSNPSARIGDGASAGASEQSRLLRRIWMPCPQSDKPLSFVTLNVLFLTQLLNRSAIWQYLRGEEDWRSISLRLI